MVMNKKGFLKILESIVAVLIIFGFVLAVLPEKPALPPGIPPDLEEITNSILTGIRETPEFRSCAISEMGHEGPEYSDVECTYEYIEYLTRPNQLHPWEYGVRICRENTVMDPPVSPTCNYATSSTNGQRLAGSRPELRPDRSIYIRTITLSVDDVLGDNVVLGEDAEPEQAGIVRLLTIFAWSKA